MRLVLRWNFAHEMTCQLENAGEKVQHLFMLDSHVITYETVKEL